MNDYTHITQGAAYLLRSDTPALLLSGADRADFLQRMTTNNIVALRPGMAAVTVLTSPTARVVQVFTVLCRTEDLLLLPAPGESAALERHLRGQIFFMDKVTVRRLEGMARLRVVGPRAAEAVQALGVAPVQSGWVEAQDLITLAQQEYDLPGVELLFPDALLESVLATLHAAGAAPVTDEMAWLARRIELGRPAPGTELTGDYSPLEAGLGWACSENKGCYTGQEIIARQITYDKVTKLLVGLRTDALLAPGTALTADGREVGTVTSVAHSPALGTPVALAIVKRPHNAPGSVLLAGEVRAAVLSLPLVESALLHTAVTR